MTLVLHQQVETTLPIDAKKITPDRLVTLSNSEIQNLTVGFGNRNVPVCEIFEVSGKLLDINDATPTIKWKGNLQNVHRIGANMQSGRMVVESSTGRHVGSQMSGGEIVVVGNVSDHAGAEMTGGTIRISGNAGDLLGANYPGSKFGMNQGNIFVAGNAGKGVGQSMRRGTIIIGGSCGELTGWNMLAGTIVVFGTCAKNVGAGMTRGTIVLASNVSTDLPLPPTFTRGGTHSVPILRMLARWLQQEAPEFDPKKLMNLSFTQHHGDALKSSRGEIFVAAT